MKLVEVHDYVKRAGRKIHKEFIDEGYTGKNTSQPAFKEISFTTAVFDNSGKEHSLIQSH